MAYSSSRRMRTIDSSYGNVPHPVETHTVFVLQALEEVKIREMSIVDLQKKILEGESKLKQQQNLYEAVRTDRNLYSKNLIESQDEIQEMKRKFKIMSHQIEQLKEEISAKDLALVKEHFDHMKVEKEKESLRLELNTAKQQISEADSAIATQKSEIEKLNHIINEADQVPQLGNICVGNSCCKSSAWLPLGLHGVC